MADPPISFPAFVPTTIYPDKAKYVNITSPLPTNDWIENAIVNDVSDNRRLIPSLPWYWFPSEDDDVIYMSCVGSVPRITALAFGAIDVYEFPSHLIIVSTGDTNNVLTLENRDDLTGTFAITGDNGSMNAYIMRGSPYATYVYNGVPISLEWVESDICSLTAVTGGYQVDDNHISTSTVSQELLLVSGQYQSENLFIYNDWTADEDIPISVTFKDAVLTVKFDTYDICVNVENNTQNCNGEPFSDEITVITSDPVFGFVVDVSIDTTYIITYNIQTHLTTVSNRVCDPQRWYIFTSATLELDVVNTNKIITAGDFDGPVQIVCAGSVSEATKELFCVYQEHAGNYVTAGITGNYDRTDCNSIYDITWTRNNTNDLLWWVPPHLDCYDITELERTDYYLLTPQYGNLNLAKITSNVNNVTSPSEHWQMYPNVDCLSDCDKETLSDRARTDARRTLIDVQFPPANYGFQIFSATRIALIAQALDIVDEKVFKRLIKQIRCTLKQWLEGVNSNNTIPIRIYQLQYESLWGGVIVPADAIAATQNGDGPRANNNSFYSNHHFQYGYFFYALAGLEQLGEGLFGDYPDEILNILYDVVNPQDVSTFSTKLRHKDFYGGHSWATGIIEQVNRQQEASGEAINGYFSAWLLAHEIGETDVENAAAVCLSLELSASQTYYFLRPDTGQSIGQLENVASLGILNMQGRTFRLNNPINPNTFPGRSIGVAGVQAIPISDISFSHVDSDWVNRLNTVEEVYAISNDLVIGLNNGVYESSDQIIQPDESFNVKTSGGFWGSIGMELLAVNPDTVESQLDLMVRNLIEKESQQGIAPVLQRFESFTNIQYWILANHQLNCLGYNCLEFFLHPDGTTSSDSQCSPCSIYMKLNMNFSRSDGFELTIKVRHLTCVLAGAFFGEKVCGEGSLFYKAKCLGIKPECLLRYAMVLIGLLHLRRFCKKWCTNKKNPCCCLEYSTQAVEFDDRFYRICYNDNLCPRRFEDEQINQRCCRDDKFQVCGKGKCESTRVCKLRTDRFFDCKTEKIEFKPRRCDGVVNLDNLDRCEFKRLLNLLKCSCLKCYADFFCDNDMSCYFVCDDDY